MLLNENAYGLWGTVIFNILVFGAFTYTAFKPLNKRDWKTMGAFGAFIVALFTEMFGFPLSIYILTSILGNKYPVLDPFTHKNGHLLVAITGGSQIVFVVIHILSNVLIFAGLIVIAIGWKAIHRGNGELVKGGIYRIIRHPQYTGFILSVIGFLIQWPTIVTIIMAPLLIIMYIKLAKKEERKMIQLFGEEYKEYKSNVPAFIPKRMLSISEVISIFKSKYNA